MERCLGQGVGKACGSPRQAPPSQHLHVLSSLEGLWTLCFWGFVESAPRGHGVLPSVQEGGGGQLHHSLVFLVTSPS